MKKINLLDKVYDYVVNNKLKTARLGLSFVLLYFAISFMKLGLDIFSEPYFIESIEKLPEEYHFLVFMGLIYFMVKLSILLFSSIVNNILDPCEEDENDR